MVDKLYEFENFFTVDSMLLEVFKKVRLSRSKICKSLLFYTKKSFFASQNLHFYGY